ncbi:hypothetical protein ACFL9T_22935, partial [Thermodesulfobacteriota bacterium]
SAIVSRMHIKSRQGRPEPLNVEPEQLRYIHLERCDNSFEPLSVNSDKTLRLSELCEMKL